MFYLALMLMLITAVACFGLSRAIATRVLGFLAAAAALLAACLLAIGYAQGSPPLLPPLNWATLEQITVPFYPILGITDVILACTLLGGGAIALLALTLALAPTLRGFGSLFAWVLLTLAAALVGLLSRGLLVSFAWASVALLAYAALRASGALNRSTGMPHGVMSGLLASLLLVVALLAGLPLLAGSVLPHAGVALGMVLACLLFAGIAPFHSALDEAVKAPAALGGLLYGLVLPLLALGSLLHIVAAVRALQPDLPLPLLWRGILMGVGLLSLFACAAGALRQRSMQRLLAWQMGAQAGLVLLALSLEGALAVLAVPALLLNLALTTLTGSLAVAVVERLTGSDDFTQVQPGFDLRLPGVLWALAAASALGLPASWGFWGRLWLLEAALAQAAWLAPCVVAASMLMGLAYLSPLACFWWRGSSRQGLVLTPETPQAATNPFVPVLVLVPIPLLLVGLVPQVLWWGGLRLLPGAPASLPVSITAQTFSVVLALLAAVLAITLLRARSARRALPDDDMSPVMLAPSALSQRLALLAGFGYPAPLIDGLWKGLLLVGQWVRSALALFEQRFYLAAVLLAVISLILLIAQG